jgi:hypothetical protein
VIPNPHEETEKTLPGYNARKNEKGSLG